LSTVCRSCDRANSPTVCADCVDFDTVDAAGSELEPGTAVVCALVDTAGVAAAGVCPTTG